MPRSSSVMTRHGASWHVCHGCALLLTSDNIPQGLHFAGNQNSLGRARPVVSTIQDSIRLPASRSSSIDFTYRGKSGFPWNRRVRPRRRPAAVIVLSGEDGGVRRPHDASGATINISSLDRAVFSVQFAPWGVTSCPCHHSLGTLLEPLLLSSPSTQAIKVSGRCCNLVC